MAGERSVAPGPPEGELVITRVFDAPPELVWKAWTEPEHFRRWWGPNGFTSPSCVMDVRVGGRYVWCMRRPDGVDFHTAGEYREVIPHERLVFTHSPADEDGNVSAATRGSAGGDTLITVTFESVGGRTRMTMTHAGLPADEWREHAAVGWNQAFDKLAATLQ